jgi:hypothetical protein
LDVAKPGTPTRSKMIKEFPFKMDPKLRQKLEGLLATLDKKDIWILVDGDEGSGKTNTAAYLLYFFHCATGREFSVNQFYFDAEALFNYAKSTEKKLINWDEAALGGLSVEWYNQSQINLLKFAMTGRKKHHIFVLCIPRFDKLKEDLRSDRIHAIIHMDTGKYNNKYGHFIYLTRRGLKMLNSMFKKSRIRAYKKCAYRYGGFCANIDIPFVFNKLIDADEYERKKDAAIMGIGVKKDSYSMEKLRDLRHRIATLTWPVTSRQDMAKKLRTTDNNISKWVITPRNLEERRENPVLSSISGLTLSNGESGEEKNNLNTPLEAINPIYEVNGRYRKLENDYKPNGEEEDPSDDGE